MQVRDETVVADPRWVSPAMWIGFPVLGAGLGWVLVAISDWVASLEWAPLRGPFRLLASLDQPLAAIAAHESVAVRVADDGVAIRRAAGERRFERQPVRAVFVDGKQLVLLGPATEELIREKTDQPARRLRDAFVAHGYPWHDEDPYRDAFRRWVEDMPDLPTGAGALFKARARALANDDKTDAAQLRTELSRLGLVVRDEKKRQFWRTARADR